MKGKLITIEGIDGSGKSTINKRLKLHFRDDHDVVFTREPTKSWIGEAVQLAISSHIDPLSELFLFIADHADHISSVIRPALEEGKTVISDRYSDSRYAYQAVTLKGTIDSPLEWVMGLHRGWTIVPDLTILLDVPPNVAITRVGNRKSQTKFEKMAFLTDVRENYLELVDREPGRFLVVDAKRSLRDVEAEIVMAVKDVVG